jgi:hypothetical protein
MAKGRPDDVSSSFAWVRTKLNLPGMDDYVPSCSSIMKLRADDRLAAGILTFPRSGTDVAAMQSILVGDSPVQVIVRPVRGPLLVGRVSLSAIRLSKLLFDPCVALFWYPMAEVMRQRYEGTLFITLCTLPAPG